MSANKSSDHSNGGLTWEIKKTLSHEKIVQVQTILDKLISDSFYFREFKNDLTFLRDSLGLFLRNEAMLVERLSRMQKTYSEMKRVCARTSDEDKRAMEELRGQLERAWRDAIEAERAETKMRETVDLYKSDTNYLTKLVCQDTGIRMGQERTLRDVLKEKESLEVRNEMLLDDLKKLSGELDELNARNQNMLKLIDEAKINEHETNRLLLDSRLDIKKNEAKIEKLQVLFKFFMTKMCFHI